MKNVYIYDAARTPLGSFQGQLSALQGWQLGGSILKSLHERKNIIPQEVIMGNVLGAGQGQAPCRQAVRFAFENGDEISATTINKVCGSGLQSIMFAADQIQLNPQRIMMAGGFESMSNAPYLLKKARSGYRMGHDKIFDHMMMDGLEDAYDIGKDGSRRAMGVFADKTAQKYQITREDQEEYVKTGFSMYQAALSEGYIANEICPIYITDSRGNTITVQTDEPPTRVKVEKLNILKPAFGADGTVTAATSSGIADGAAAVLLGSADLESHIKSAPLARIVGYVSHGTAPEWFTCAPIGAIQKLLHNVGWNVSDVDLFEINEAFAVVTMAAIHDLKLDRQKVNVFGGACTLGHPIGASGARVLVTLINALKTKGLKRGVAALCIGGGEAVAMAIECL